MKAATQLKPKVNWREAIWGYIFVAPGFFFVFAFVLIPVVSALGISFTNWNLINSPQFVGLENYQQILTDPVAVKTLLNTFYFTFISVPVSLAISLVLAVLLNQKIRGLTFFRTAFYIPVISSTVAVAMVFLWIFDSNYGLMNQFIGIFGVSPINWLTDTRFAMPAVIMVTVWRSLGFNMIIYLAALQDVPSDIHDAAAIDGAGEIQKFFNIILPLISPAVFFTSITGIISSFQSFDLVYNMTNGGPARSTYLIGYYIWEQAFKYLHMGYGSALAFVLFLAIAILTLVQWSLRRRWVYGEE
jgi:multiple sugar transport system permease protein